MSENETSMPLDPLAGWVQTLRDAQQNKAFWEDQEKHAKEQIKRVMNAAEATVGTVENAPVVRMNRYVRRGLDSQGIKRDYPDIAEQYEVSTAVESLSIVEK